MAFKYKPNPNYRSPKSTQKIMMNLTIGLAVVYVFALYHAATLGAVYLKNAIVMMVVALVCAEGSEAIWALATKQKNVVNYLKNSFGWVTAIILVLCCPLDLHPYAVGVASIIAIVFGKLVFGGFGQNVFNPAGVGRAVIVSSFASMKIVDALAGATPTAHLASSGWLMKSYLFEQYLADFGGLSNLWFGLYNGAMGETSTLVLIAVGVYLSVVGAIDWYIPVTYIGTIFLGSTLIGCINGVGITYSLAFIATGGIFFGGIFMLTDPVTNPNNRSGKIVFAAVAALFTVLIRLFANFPEGVVFSILLANMLTPVIEKIFLSKQVDVEKKLNIAVPAFVVAVVAVIACCGAGLEFNYDYKTPEKNKVAVAGEVYEGTGEGFYSDVAVKVTVADGVIVAIEVDESANTQKIASDEAIQELADKIVAANDPSIPDSIAGATFTTNGIKAAVKDAMKGAK